MYISHVNGASLHASLYFHRSIGDVIKKLKAKIERSRDQESAFEMVVRRGKILNDTLRRMERVTFDANKPIRVYL